MSASPASGAAVVVRPAATLGGRAAGLALLLADSSPPDELAADAARIGELADAGALNLAGLLVARPTTVGPDRRSKWPGVVGATLVTPGPGGAADLFVPRLAIPAPEGTAATLLAGAATFAAAAGCDRLQAFVDPTRTDDATTLRAAGFERLAELRTLRRSCATPLTESHAASLALLTLSPETERLFRESNRRSYADSRDAPNARGADADADFDAHRDAPGFRPDLCRLALVDDRPAGLALIAVGEEGGGAAWDVCYLGVAPAFRGRGVGRALLLDRLAAARDAGAATATCTVDAANGPARRLYAAAGFVETGSRDLFLRRLEPG